jgi:aconitase A
VDENCFKNVDVIPAGNGIMHQINLEKMSPVIQNRDGLAFLIPVLVQIHIHHIPMRLV